MPYLTFKPLINGRRDHFAPHHCDRPIRFGILTSCCRVCGEQFHTPDVLVALQHANGCEPDPELAELASLVVGSLTGQPLHAKPREPSPAENLAAEKLTRETLAKAAEK